MMFQGLTAFAYGKPAMYDVYAIDHGCYILLKGTEKGAGLVSNMHRLGKVIKGWFGQSNSELGVIWNPKVERDIRVRFGALFDTEVRVVDSKEFSSFADDCAKLVADKTILSVKV
jgi:hypothetical protein